MERVGSFGLFLGEGKTQLEPNLSYDGPIYGGTLTLMQADNPIALQATVLKSDQEYEASSFNVPFRGDIVSNFYDLEVGYFIREGLIIGIGYAYRDEDINIAAFGNTASFSYESDEYMVASKFVHTLGGGGGRSISKLSSNKRKQ